MKILIKRKALKKIQKYIFLILLFIPAAFLAFCFFSEGDEIWTNLTGIKKESAPEFTFTLPGSYLKTTYKQGSVIENDKDETLIYTGEIIPDDIFPLVTPDPNRTYYEVKEIDASRSADACGISINDSTSSGTDIAAKLSESFEPEFADYELFSGEPLVLIYHTHTSESYEQSFRGFYYEDDVYRTLDESENVCAVGEALKEVLEKAGIGVLHDTTYHDSPAFNGAYSRSKETALSYLEKYPSIKITIDLHRDAMVTDEGLSYKPTTKIDSRKAAQMMIIAGCDPDGELGYDNWETNLLFSLQTQKAGESLYPGLMRPLMFCRRSYNMGLTDTSFLVEVGTQSNTLSEAVYSGKLLGNILTKVITENLN